MFPDRGLTILETGMELKSLYGVISIYARTWVSSLDSDLFSRLICRFVSFQGNASRSRDLNRDREFVSLCFTSLLSKMRESVKHLFYSESKPPSLYRDNTVLGCVTVPILTCNDHFLN